MDKPLSCWYCDMCDEKIENSSEGYVIWKIGEEMSHEFTIIHQGRCDLREYRGSAALTDFLGPNGLSYCLTFLSLGPVALHAHNVSRSKVKGLDGFVDFVRRVQVPYYEEARRHYSNPDLLSALSDASELYPYIPQQMRLIIDEYGDGGKW